MRRAVSPMGTLGVESQLEETRKLLQVLEAHRDLLEAGYTPFYEESEHGTREDSSWNDPAKKLRFYDTESALQHLNQEKEYQKLLGAVIVLMQSLPIGPGDILLTLRERFFDHERIAVETTMLLQLAEIVYGKFRI